MALALAQFFEFCGRRTRQYQTQNPRHEDIWISHPDKPLDEGKGRPDKMINALIKFAALVCIDLLKHYTAKIKHTTVDSMKAGKREKRLLEKIKNRWEEK
jgi:hypothetical protein